MILSLSFIFTNWLDVISLMTFMLKNFVLDLLYYDHYLINLKKSTVGISVLFVIVIISLQNDLHFQQALTKISFKILKSLLNL